MKKRKYLLHPMLHSADLIEDRLRRQLSPLGVRPRQARVLNALDRMGEASQVELTRAFDITAASMSTMTDRLLAAGLIYRRIDPAERRTHILGLTKKGATLLDEIRAAWGEIDRIIIEAIGEEEANALADKATRLRVALGGEIPGRRAVKARARNRQGQTS
ncbi:MarR family winged helix-turn-helix transcriptional regulator [Roseobacter sp. A03A-229]